MGELTSSWQITAGPVHIKAVVRSGTVTWIYVFFNAICFVSGVIFIGIGGVTLTALGTSIIVGALFAFGSFVSQFWAVVAQRERQMSDFVFAIPKMEEFKQLANHIDGLNERINILNQDTKSTDEPADGAT
jgi:hypothetical protein